MASFHPSDSPHSCLELGWIQLCKSAAELQRAANSLASYPYTAGLELMTPDFSVLAQENKMISGLVLLCNRQISLVDQALLWDSDKSSNPHLLVCRYPNHLVSLGHSSLSSLICLGSALLGLGTPSAITIHNHIQRPCLSQQHLIRKLHYF